MFFAIPQKGSIRTYVKTPEHGATVASWVGRAVGKPVEYSDEKKGWEHAGHPDVVSDCMDELSHRMLYQKIELKGASQLQLSAMRSRLIHFRIVRPGINIHSKPDLRKAIEDNNKCDITVWILATPDYAYEFSEVVCEFHGIAERFLIVTWRPEDDPAESFFNCENDRREFSRKHGVAGISRLRDDGTVIFYGTSESIACATEELSGQGRIVRKGK